MLGRNGNSGLVAKKSASLQCSQKIVRQKLHHQRSNTERPPHSAHPLPPRCSSIPFQFCIRAIERGQAAAFGRRRKNFQRSISQTKCLPVSHRLSAQVGTDYFTKNFNNQGSMLSPRSSQCLSLSSRSPAAERSSGSISFARFCIVPILSRALSSLGFSSS